MPDVSQANTRVLLSTLLLVAESVPTRRLRCVAEGSRSGRSRRKPNGALRCPGWRAGPGWRALCERARQSALLSTFVHCRLASLWARGCLESHEVWDGIKTWQCRRVRDVTFLAAQNPEVLTVLFPSLQHTLSELVAHTASRHRVEQQGLMPGFSCTCLGRPLPALNGSTRTRRRRRAVDSPITTHAPALETTTARAAQAVALICALKAPGLVANPMARDRNL